MKRMTIAVVLYVLALPLQAQVTEPPGAENWDTLRQRGAELHEKAKKIRADAAARHGEAERTCPNELFAATCMDDANKKRTEVEREAKRFEREARELDRRVRAHERELKEAKRAEEAPQREAEALRHAEKNRREQEEALRRVERKAAEDAARQQGRRRAAP